MKTYYYKTQQLLATDIASAWHFFSSPLNLSTITPPSLDFKIQTASLDKEIFAGMQIDYVVKPLFGIPVHWRTEIVMTRKPKLFIDKQVKGPYKLWEHTHHFMEVDKKVLMTDEVKYQLPFGVLGLAAHSLLVKKKIKGIFTYRRKTLDILFNNK